MGCEVIGDGWYWLIAFFISLHILIFSLIPSHLLIHLLTHSFIHIHSCVKKLLLQLCNWNWFAPFFSCRYRDLFCCWVALLFFLQEIIKGMAVWKLASESGEAVVTCECWCWWHSTRLPSLQCCVLQCKMRCDCLWRRCHQSLFCRTSLQLQWDQWSPDSTSALPLL